MGFRSSYGGKGNYGAEGKMQRIMKLLDMGDYNMVVVVKSHTYLENNTLFQCTESRHRPDKFRFVDLAKRNCRRIQPQFQIPAGRVFENYI